MVEPSALTNFADVRRRITRQLRHNDACVLELGPDAGSLTVTEDRASVGVVEAGAALPGTPDILLVVGPSEQLAHLAEQLSDESELRRVQLLPLPCPPVLADRALYTALSSAETQARARMADQLLDIGTALNAERDPARVLDLILRHARAITGADAGSIYLLEDNNTLRFRIAHNDSVDAPLKQFTMPVTASSIVGAAVLSKATIRIRDLYDPAGSIAAGRSFSHDRTFDERFKYQTRSMITTPMISPEGKVLAVIQLINAKVGPEPFVGLMAFRERVRPFSAHDERLCDSLASQAAVALESARLFAEIQTLFEGFVRASVHAIEQRDPTTSGHSQRVADLTVSLARAADQTSAGPFAELHFTKDQLTEIEYAGLLHDFGKVGVREEVLVKAKKLYPYQLELVTARFEHLRTSIQLDMMRTQLATLRSGGSDDGSVARAAQARLTELDGMLAVIKAANEPSVLPQSASARLRAVATARYTDAAGKEHALLTGDEVEALLVERGSLTPAERLEIQSHVTHTYNFLVRIPWGHHLQRVPEIAGKHHEYLDGSGYPAAVASSEIPVQARMMTVADIFDALTASDRPYKKAVPVVKALDILTAEVKRGKVDADILALFVATKVWQRGVRT
ncbi:MAG: GAF domain-containing protein [Nannocystaceae bacterium]|nr:GAF domain-containing protein [Nannocystaceae bacterium]